MARTEVQSDMVDHAPVSVASAGTTNIGATKSDRVDITGTTTITSFGTGANKIRYVRFAAALTLTHNATSLILPGGSNISTAAGDTAIFSSDGSGNWRCLAYQRADGTPLAGTIPFALGLVGTPSITFAGDLNTGMWSPAADTIAFSTAGSERVRVNSAGSMILGSTAVIGSELVSLQGDANAQFFQLIRNVNAGSSAWAGLVLNASGNSWGIRVGSSAANSNALQFAVDALGTPASRMSLATDGMLSFNSGYGSVAPAYGCRAWVNFNGTGTVAINASANVSSITDNGTGDYTVNFTNSMPDTNYVISINGRYDTNGTIGYFVGGILRSGTAQATGSVRIGVVGGSFTAVDAASVQVAVFR